MGRLEGKVAWVTGGGSGIGEAAALMLAEEGAAVVLTGRRHEPLGRVAARIQQQGGTAHVQPGDLTEPAAVRRIGDFISRTRSAASTSSSTMPGSTSTTGIGTS